MKASPIVIATTAVTASNLLVSTKGFLQNHVPEASTYLNPSSVVQRIGTFKTVSPAYYTTEGSTRNVLDQGQDSPPLYQDILLGPHKRHGSKKRGSINQLVTIRPKEIKEVLVQKSRPRKRPVSFHAICCLFALGSFVSTLLPLFAPGRDGFGIPRIWNVCGHNEHFVLRQMQISSWLMTISGMMGLLRIPRSAPPSRRLLFESSAFYCLFISLYVTSNLTGTSAAMFDAFQLPGKLLVAGSGLIAWLRTLPVIHDSIVGPMKGRNTLPLAGTRRSSVAAAVIISVMSILFFPLMLPAMASNLASYQTHVASFIQGGRIEGSQLSANVCIQAALWLAPFFATKLYEKKMKPSTASLACGLTLFLLGFDPIMLVVAGLFLPSSLVGGESMLSYYTAIVEKYHVNQIAFGFIALTILNALRKVALMGRGTTGVSGIEGNPKQLVSIDMKHSQNMQKIDYIL